MTIIQVNGPTPYEVTIDHDLDAAVADCAADTGATRVMVIHQPTLVEPARKLGEALVDRGLSADD